MAGPGASHGGVPSRAEARRSLKTQQHAHLESVPASVREPYSECASRFDLPPALRGLWQPEIKQYSSTPSTHPGLLHVYEQPLV